MKGDLMPIVTYPGVMPTTLNTPAPVLLYWAENFKKDLDKDVAIWIIEPVPLNTPTRIHSFENIVNRLINKYCKGKYVQDRIDVNN